VIAALTLVWQQQATLATFIDADYAKASFTAATLNAITPGFTTTAATATGSWTAPSGPWATPGYVLTGATTSTGGNAAQVYAGSALTFTQTVGANSTTANLTLTDISAGGTHACGIARGQLYCWGTSAGGALGPGTTSPTSTPTLVTTFANKTATDVSAGTDFTCAVADGDAYCWGSGGNGRTGLGGTANTSTPTAVVGIPSGKTVTSISAGATHACAVASGTAYCWGNNGSGQLGIGSTTSTTSAVAVTTATGILSGRTVTSVAAGTSHSCAVADGLAFCWGTNTNGQLGDASTTQHTAPFAVSTSGVLNGRTVSAISAGDAHTCAVADASAYCWGLTTNGRVGNGVTTATNQSSPVAVTGSVATSGNVTAISAGSTHSCAIASNAAHCWGGGASGQLGNGSNTASAGAAVAVTTTGALSGRTLTSISAGTAFTCSRGDTPGSCWGLGTGGQLGNKASASTTTAVDAAITGPVCTSGAVRLNATDCSLEEGTDYWGRLGYSIGTWAAPNSAWVKATTKSRAAVSPASTAKTATSLTLGWDQVSELSRSYAEFTLQRSTSSSGSNPVTVYRGGMLTALDRGGLAKRNSSLGVTQVSAGTDHTCGILEGAAYCWGDDTNGELGIGSTTDARVPTAVVTTGVLSGKTVTEISAGMDDANGGQHTCAVADGGVYCWGLNSHGELGNGTNTQSTTPVQAGSITGVTDVATGYMHSCALTGGKVYCWGDNSRGQLGDGSNNQRTSPVLVQGALANKTVTAIAAGAAHTCAIAGGAAYCWGSNVSGQLGVNNNTNSAVPLAVLSSGALSGLTVSTISAGQAHTCAIAGGKAYCWGINNNGQLGNNSTINTTVAVAVTAPWATGAALSSLSAGMYSTCVVAAGKAYCWGDNSNGQLGNGNTTDQKTPVAVTATGVLSGTVDQVTAGATHSCAVSASVAYCWGENAEGRLGNNTTTASTVPVTVQAVAGPPCASGANLITPSTCSLTSGTTYYYRVKYVVDGGLTNTSDWVAVKTN
jgi:alpha-tubulin suppressor-like RCC1 family protein